MADKKGVFLGNLSTEENMELKEAQRKLAIDEFYGEVPSIRKLVLTLIRMYMGK